ncbi:MAG: agmatinase [Promethearchaeota archaeon]|nr:MAG: agmatinase [Candidatus Lokiarchaeota archaeon]
MSFYDYGGVIDKNTKFVIFGIPWDYLTSIEAPNSAIAPDKIREVTNNLALSTEMGAEIPKLKVVDIGDIPIERENIETNLTKIKKFVKEIYRQKNDVIPIMIGGDHFCSYPVIKAVGDNFERKDEFGVLIFDAHLDFYEEWDKGVYSHATISHRVFDLKYINDTNLLIVGTRDIDIPELKLSEEENIHHFDAYLVSEYGLSNLIDNIIDFFQNSKIKYLYVSIDIDVFDPSTAPATGYAIPGGLTYREIWQILKSIASKFNIIGFDLVEVAPNLDLPNNLTSNLAAKLIAEFISFISLNFGENINETTEI